MVVLSLNVRNRTKSQKGSSATIVRWHQYFRDIFADYFVANPRRIDIPGVAVKIDDTSIFKQKYNVGRLPGQKRQWMFGGIERERERLRLQIIHATYTKIL